MSPLLSSTSYLPLSSSFCRSRSDPSLQLHQTCCTQSCLNDFKNSSASLKFPPNWSNSIWSHHLVSRAKASADEGTVAVMSFEDLAEKDWSFLEVDDIKTEEQHNQTTEQIILAGEIGETSRVLISIGSEGFVDKIVNSYSFQQLLVVHESLLILACVKEKHDIVKCWQGELIYLPEKWAPFDVIYLYCLPALPFPLAQVLEVLAKQCLPGARVVISHPQGRETVEKQQEQYPEMIVSKLPDKMTLQAVAADHLFTVDRYVDKPGLYLSVLKFNPMAE